MSRRSDRAQEAILDLLTTGPDSGFTTYDMRQAFLKAGLATERDMTAVCGFAISAIRTKYEDELVIYDRRTGRYRLAITDIDALVWIAHLIDLGAGRLHNARGYIGKAERKFPSDDGLHLRCVTMSLKLNELIEDSDKLVKALMNGVGA